MMIRVAVSLALLVPLVAGAQSFRCVGKDGKKYYGSAVPPQCAGAVVEQLSAQGTVIRRIDPAADGKAREDKAAAEAQKRQDDAAAKEAARRRSALLATYASEKDIEDARARALSDNARAAKDLEARIDTMKKGKGKDADVKTLEGMLATKRSEAAAINARYDQEKKQYVEMTKK